MKILEISALAFNKNYFKFLKDVKNFKDKGIVNLHYDVMDNIFVPNTSFKNLQHLNYLIKQGFNISVHLMVNDVEKYLKKLVYKNIKYITFHCESQDIEKSKDLIRFIKSKNIKAGIAIKPNTDIKKYQPLLKMCDIVTVMSVEPGFGGQKYIANSEKRAKEIKSLAREDTLIQIDGGINEETLNISKNYCDMFVSGSFLYNNINDYQKFVNLISK